MIYLPRDHYKVSLVLFGIKIQIIICRGTYIIKTPKTIMKHEIRAAASSRFFEVY